MQKYWYITKNSFKEANKSKLVFIITLLQPLILLYGYILFYGYMANPGTIVEYNSPIVVYYIFILVVSAIDLTRFANDLQKKIQTDEYISIDKLPINPFLYYFFTSLGRTALIFLILLSVAIYYLLSIQFNILGILLFTPASIISFFLAHLIFFNLSMATFFIESIHVWVFGITVDLLSGKLIPLSLMPLLLTQIFLLLPFPYAFGAIARNYSDFNLANLLINLSVSLFWSFLLYLTAEKLWQKGSYYYQENS